MSVRAKIEGDFKVFLTLVWRHLKLPDPTPRQLEIADWLQSQNKRKMVIAFRGVGKSWITSAYCLWCLYKDPEEKILIVSASKQRADDFSTFTQRLITDMPMLKYLKPKDDQRWSKIAFDVKPARPAHAPSVKSVGITGQLTGSRATKIIVDDVEVLNNSATQEMREKLLHLCEEFDSILVPSPNAEICVLGTPQTEESVYIELRERTYMCRIWTAEVPSDTEKYKGCLAPSIQKMCDEGVQAGKPTDPMRFNEIDLNERKASMGRSTYQLQFMLDTQLSDVERYPLKLSDLVVMDVDHERAPLSVTYGSGSLQQIKDIPCVGFSGDRLYAPMSVDTKVREYEGSMMFIDPSGRGTDELAYVVLKQLHGFLYLCACDGLKGGYDEVNLIRLSKVAKEYKVNVVVIEDNFGDGMFTQLLKPVLAKYHRVTIEEVKHHTQKELRIIDCLEPVMNRHRLIVDRKLIERDAREALDSNSRAYSLQYQLTRITRDRGAIKHDDRLDALAGGVRYWVEIMSRDEDQAIQDWNNEQFEIEYNKFLEDAEVLYPSNRKNTFSAIEVW